MGMRKRNLENKGSFRQPLENGSRRAVKCGRGIASKTCWSGDGRRNHRQAPIHQSKRWGLDASIWRAVNDELIDEPAVDCCCDLIGRVLLYEVVGVGNRYDGEVFFDPLPIVV